MTERNTNNYYKNYFKHNISDSQVKKSQVVRNGSSNAYQ